MTTVAWDGNILAADTLGTDNYGLKSFQTKLFKGVDWIAGGAGDWHNTNGWYKQVEHLKFKDIVEGKISNWHKDDNHPSIIITNGEESYRACGDMFMSIDRGYHAIGSGRDFALAAMCCGKNAVEAVNLAASFDNNTGGLVQQMEMK